MKKGEPTVTRTLFKYARTLILGAVLSAISFIAPPFVYAATTTPPLPMSAHQCVTGGVLSPDATCRANLDAARAKWRGALVALDGATHGNGDFIVPNRDGSHFDLMSVHVYLGSPTSTGTAGSNAARSVAFHPVQDVYALGVAYSNSGSIGIGGYYCGAILGWSGSVFYNTWYGGHVEMDVQGWLKHCYYAVTTNLTPVTWGAGSWTFTSGVIGNYTWTTNPWINYYGSFWGCCSDTVLERLYMNGNGNWSIVVYN